MSSPGRPAGAFPPPVARVLEAACQGAASVATGEPLDAPSTYEYCEEP